MSDERLTGTAPGSPRFRDDAPWMAVLLIVTLWHMIHVMGVSPTVWVDTFHEDDLVRECVQDNSCSIVGPGATINIFHSAGYLHWRALLVALGAGPDGTHAVILAINALGVVLVAIAARWLGGRVAAAIAAVLMLTSLGTAMQTHVNSDVAPLPFLGAVFLLIAVSARFRPALGSTFLMGLVGAVVANTYASGLLCGVSAVWIALLLPGRGRHVAAAAVSFAMGTFLIAPGTWIENLRVLGSRGLAGNAPMGSMPTDVLAVPMVQLTGLATLCWFVILVARLPLRRQLEVPAAIVLPLFLPLAIGSLCGWLQPLGKYGSTVIGPAAAAVAIPAAQLVRLLPVGLTAPLERAAPWLASGAIAIGFVPLDWSESAHLEFTARDVSRARHILAREQGWTREIAARNLKTPNEVVRRALLRTEDWPASPQGASGGTAYLLRIPSSLLPAAPASHLRPISSTDATTTVLSLGCTWIDWSSMHACTQFGGGRGETCTPEGSAPEDREINELVSAILREPNLGRRVLRMDFALRPSADCPAQAIDMPRMTGVCPGSIVSISGGTEGIDPSARHAELKLTDAYPRRLVVDFDLDSPQCPHRSLGAPFFLTGAPEAVAVLSSLLQVRDP